MIGEELNGGEVKNGLGWVYRGRKSDKEKQTRNKSNCMRKMNTDLSSGVWWVGEWVPLLF